MINSTKRLAFLALHLSLGACTADVAKGAPQALLDGSLDFDASELGDSGDDATLECQPGKRQACRGDDACWGHRNCSDQATLGDCICETGSAVVGSDASTD